MIAPPRAARLSRSLSSALIAAMAFALVLSPPDFAALPDADAGPADRVERASALDDVATAQLAAELAYQRLKTLGLEPADARIVVDATVAHESFESVDAQLAARLASAEALEAALVVRLLEDRLLPVARLMTPGELAAAFGLAEEMGIEFDAGPVVALSAGSGARRGIDMGARAMSHEPAPTPTFNGTCQSCPNFDFGCFTPTGSWQFHGSSLGPALSDCNWYCFNVVSGTTYQFSTCSDVGGLASFDTVLDLFQPPAAPGPCIFKSSNDDNCAPVPLSSFISWTADFSGTTRLRVRGKGGVPGSYTLAYRKICPAASSCSASDGVLFPTTTCQYQAGVVDDCTNDRYYSVAVVAARTYDFSLGCNSCPAASASFDSLLELYASDGSLGASETWCGPGTDDGAFTLIPFVDGTVCIRVHREAGATDDFNLGYVVACQAPVGVVVAPDSASTVALDCTRDQRFSVAAQGTPDLTYAWTITPAPGNSATPSAGTTTSSSNNITFNSLLQGEGTYVVTVTVTNACGSATSTVDYVLEDRAGPALTTTVDAASCGPVPIRSAYAPMGARRAALLDRLTQMDRTEVMEALMVSSDPHVAEQAIARKLGISASQIRVVDSLNPSFFRAPGAAAVSCATPCTGFGTLSASNPYYDVYLSCDDGAFTARTGVSHSVTVGSGAPQNVIFGGAGGSPGTSDITFRVHDTNDDFLSPTGGQTCTFNPADTALEPNSQGVESEWTRTVAGGRSLTLREEIVAFGSAESNSGIRLTLGATNSPTSAGPVTMGVRWQIDYQNGGDDGPLYAQVLCGPPFEVFNERSTEHEFTSAEVAGQDFYRIQNNTGSPIFGNFTGTTALAGFDGTGKPDRLIYGLWPTMRSSAWTYGATEGANADFDSAVLYYFGYAAVDGITIAPGASFTRSVIIFSAGDAQDCGSFRPGTCDGATLELCPGECAFVGATAQDNCGPATVRLIGTSPGSPTCVGNPCLANFPDEGTFVYTWEAVDESGNRAECTSTVVVANGPRCNQPPTCSAGGPYASTCRDAAVDGASVDDPDGDPITFTWTSDRADVVITPPSGVVPGAPGARMLPPAVATLDAATAPCGVVANLTLSVDDGRGGLSSCVTSVSFADAEAPTLTPVTDVTAECDAVPPPPPVAAIDACDPNPALTYAERRIDGSCPGEYTLIRTWDSTDACGNAAGVQQVVTVVDTTPPTVTAAGGSIACMWPPNHWYVGFSVADLRVEVSDNCSEPVSVELAGCVSDQPDDAPDTASGTDWNGDGHTENDCVISPDGQTIYVRSERCGTGPTAQEGRHYSVLVIATDACGNSSAPVPAGTILVPHDQSPRSTGCRNPTRDGIREIP